MIDLFLSFFCFLLFLLTLFWAQTLFGFLKYQVPLISTNKKIRSKMIEVANLKNQENIVEIGCGWGHILFDLAKKYPQKNYIGYEILYFLILINRLRSRLSKRNITFLYQDFFTADFSKTDVVFCYLWSRIMQRFYETKWKQMKKGSQIISHAFKIKELTPKEIIKIGTTKIYVYEKD